MKLRLIAAHLVVILCGLSVLAQSPEVERISTAPEGLSHDVTAALEEKGYRVALDDGWTAELWLAKSPKLSSGGGAEALYPELSNGEFVGVLHLPKGMTDFRGQAVPAGTYTLRYQLLPQDGNHLGVAPNPDFLLAIPAASDTKPDAVYPYEKLVALSAKATGTHPAVIAMEKAGEPGTATVDDQKLFVLTVNIPSAAGKPEPAGIVLKGQATQ